MSVAETLELEPEVHKPSFLPDRIGILPGSFAPQSLTLQPNLRMLVSGR